MKSRILYFICHCWLLCSLFLSLASSAISRTVAEFVGRVEREWAKVGTEDFDWQVQLFWLRLPPPFQFFIASTAVPRSHIHKVALGRLENAIRTQREKERNILFSLGWDFVRYGRQVCSANKSIRSCVLIISREFLTSSFSSLDFLGL